MSTGTAVLQPRPEKSRSWRSVSAGFGLSGDGGAGGRGFPFLWHQRIIDAAHRMAEIGHGPVRLLNGVDLSFYGVVRGFRGVVEGLRRAVCEFDGVVFRFYGVVKRFCGSHYRGYLPFPPVIPSNRSRAALGKPRGK